MFLRETMKHKPEKNPYEDCFSQGITGNGAASPLERRAESLLLYIL